jgi:hypothetical protein
MGLIKMFRVLKTINEVKSFIKDHEDIAERASLVIRTLKKGIVVLKENKDNFQTYIDKAEKIVNKLEKVLDK